MKFILNNYMCFHFSDNNLYQHIFLECFADYFMFERALIICKYILFCTLGCGCQRGGGGGGGRQEIGFLGWAWPWGKFPFGNWTFSFGITLYYSGTAMNF